MSVLYVVKSVQISFAAKNAKSNGSKSLLSVQDVVEFFSGVQLSYCITIALMTEIYSAVNIARANGLGNIVDLNHTLITSAKGYNVNITGMRSGKDTLKRAIEG